MLSQRSVYPTIPASDLSRAQRWYEEKLGMTPRIVEEMGLRCAILHAGGGTGFLLYSTSYAGQAPNTLMTFFSTDVRADVVALRARGVVYEDYDFPGLKMVDGVAKLGDREGAWFKELLGRQYPCPGKSELKQPTLRRPAAKAALLPPQFAIQYALRCKPVCTRRTPCPISTRRLPISTKSAAASRPKAISSASAPPRWR